MASQNRKLNRGSSTVDATQKVGVEVEFLKGVDGLEALSLLDLDLLLSFLLFLHAFVDV